MEDVSKIGCQVCRDIEPIYPRSRTETTIAELRHSSEACFTCKVIWKGICVMKLSVDGAQEAESQVRWYNGGSGSLTVDIRYNAGDYEYLQLSAKVGQRPPWPNLKTVTPVVSNPYSRECFNQLRNWLATCDLQHELCRRKTSNTFLLPTRVIDVGQSGDYYVPFLRSRTGEAPLASYTAFSHVWGDPKRHNILRTTKSTLGAMEHGISWCDLPRSFQDAVTITRRLGIRYLWIDSLCIIQDDKEDWEVESAKMAEVYENAYLVIAATGAANGNEGCFLRREIDQEVSFTNSDGNKSSLSIRRRLEHADFNHPIIWHPRAPPSPLLKRGWVYQERLLAHRIIHFYRAELVWECKTNNWCECGHLDTFSRFNPRKFVIDSLDYKSDLATIEHANTWKIYQHWTEIVRHFASRDLTYKSDRLAALSGLASKVQIPKLGRYLAGLWECHLLQGLQWYMVYEKKTTEESAAYVAPTWSWASLSLDVLRWSSINSRARFAGDVFQTAHSQILDVEVIPSNIRSPLGSVCYGQLTIKGRLLEGHLERSDQDQDPVMLAMIRDPSAPHVIVEQRSYMSQRVFSMDDERVPEVIQGIIPRQTVFLILLESYKSLREDELDYEAHIALVLRKVPGSDEMYERIGYFDSMKDWFVGVGENIVTIV